MSVKVNEGRRKINGKSGEKKYSKSFAFFDSVNHSLSLPAVRKMVLMLSEK
jgi:hypothetical protein